MARQFKGQWLTVNLMARRFNGRWLAENSFKNFRKKFRICFLKHSWKKLFENGFLKLFMIFCRTSLLKNLKRSVILFFFFNVSRYVLKIVLHVIFYF